MGKISNFLLTHRHKYHLLPKIVGKKKHLIPNNPPKVIICTQNPSKLSMNKIMGQTIQNLNWNFQRCVFCCCFKPKYFPPFWVPPNCRLRFWMVNLGPLSNMEIDQELLHAFEYNSNIDLALFSFSLNSK